MSFTGTLDDFSPVEIISVLDLLEKSGKLHLNRDEDEGLVIFRRGKIIYAASSGFRENLGTMLLARGLVDEGQLVEALGRQVASTDEKRLGTILIEMGALSQDDLNSVILEQVIRTVSEFGHWDSGNFVFSSVHVADHGEVELHSGELWAPLGLSPNHVMLRIAQALDETTTKEPAAPSDVETQEKPEPVEKLLLVEEPVSVDVAEPELPDSEDVVAEEQASLNDFVGELHGPQVKGELIQRLLEEAAKSFGRCVLFSVRQNGFRSIAQTGDNIPEPSNGNQLLEIALSRELPSILSRCVSSGHTVMARLPQDDADHRIVDALGGPVDENSVAMPLAVRNETVLILYGDSLLETLPSGWAEDLEGFLTESGHEIEADIEAEIAAEIAAAASA